MAYHSQEPLQQLAQQLGGQSDPPELWLVVDNAPLSSPLLPSGALAPEPLGPLRLEILAGREGAGFGAGCNQALEVLEQRRWRGWVWLLNPDAMLPQPGVLGRLRWLLAQQSPRALLGTAVRAADGELEPSAGWIDPGLAFRRRRVGEEHLPGAVNAPLVVDWLSGCSLAFQPAAHQPAPRFDPALPLYYEDMDLCLRLGASGAPRLWSSAVVIGHQRGSGSGGDPCRRLELATLSYCRFLQRHTRAWVRLLRLLRLLATALLRWPSQSDRSRAVLRGLSKALREPLR